MEFILKTLPGYLFICHLQLCTVFNYQTGTAAFERTAEQQYSFICRSFVASDAEIVTSSLWDYQRTQIKLWMRERSLPSFWTFFQFSCTCTTVTSSSNNLFACVLWACWGPSPASRLSAFPSYTHIDGVTCSFGIKPNDRPLLKTQHSDLERKGQFAVEDREILSTEWIMSFNPQHR